MDVLLLRVCFRWNVFTESLPCNGYTRHNTVFQDAEEIHWKFQNSREIITQNLFSVLIVTLLR
jgi:hypothetical protein